MKSPNPRGKSLAPGDRLGSYEVIRAIGAGGMGEVYRAFDTTLGREVALKVLHQPLAWDAERLARVDREARILASLNHPNIATIHGIVPSDAGPALVLELLDKDDVLVHPGYFFDFPREAYLVVSLLIDPKQFDAAIGRVLARAATS